MSNSTPQVPHSLEDIPTMSTSEEGDHKLNTSKTTNCPATMTLKKPNLKYELVQEIQKQKTKLDLLNGELVIQDHESDIDLKKKIVHGHTATFQSTESELLALKEGQTDLAKSSGSDIAEELRLSLKTAEELTNLAEKSKNSNDLITACEAELRYAFKKAESLKAKLPLLILDKKVEDKRADLEKLKEQTLLVNTEVRVLEKKLVLLKEEHEKGIQAWHEKWIIGGHPSKLDARYGDGTLEFALQSQVMQHSTIIATLQLAAKAQAQDFNRIKTENVQLSIKDKIHVDELVKITEEHNKYLSKEQHIIKNLKGVVNDLKAKNQVLSESATSVDVVLVNCLEENRPSPRRVLEAESNKIATTNQNLSTDLKQPSDNAQAIEEQTVTISNLQKTIVVYEEDLERIRLQVLYMMPLFKVGFATRHRKLLLDMKDLKDIELTELQWEIVHAGNQAAHNGNALADSGLYDAFISEYSNMPEHLGQMEQLGTQYLEGVTPNIVRSKSSFTCFNEIISWWMDMRDFKGGHSKTALEQAFKVAWPRIWPDFEISSDEELMANAELFGLYEVMKKQRGEAREKDRQWRRLNK